MINLQAPPMLTGTEAQQLLSVRSYLFTMYKQLNQALNNLDETNFTEGGAARTVIAGGVGKETAKEINQQTTALKSLIIKNANFVKAEVDRIDAELASNYVAVSDYGTFTESITQQLEATAKSVDLIYDFQAQLDDASEAFKSYVTETNGHLRFGIVDYAEDGVTPIFGLAVGQDIKVEDETVNVDGIERAVIKQQAFRSVFTSQKLSFWQDQTEVAYMSNATLYITTAHIVRALELSDNWRIDTRSGFSIKWIGEAKK